MSFKKCQSELFSYCCQHCCKRFVSKAQLGSHYRQSKKCVSQQELASLQFMVKHYKDFVDLQEQTLQDKWLVFLSQLVQKNILVTEEDLKNCKSKEKMIGQSNYIENRVVRTTFERPMDLQKALKLTDLQTDFADDLKEISRSIQNYQKLKYQNSVPDFISYELKLIRNWYEEQRQQRLKLPQLSLLMFWLSKILKEEAWLYIYSLLIKFTQKYRKRGPASKESLKRIFNQKEVAVLQGIWKGAEWIGQPFSQGQIKLLIQLYVQWIQQLYN